MAKEQKTLTLEDVKVSRDITISYWYDKPQDMPESEQEHVREMLEQGYVEGELNDMNENRGWWRREAVE